MIRIYLTTGDIYKTQNSEQDFLQQLCHPTHPFVTVSVQDSGCVIGGVENLMKNHIVKWNKV